MRIDEEQNPKPTISVTDREYDFAAHRRDSAADTRQGSNQMRDFADETGDFSDPVFDVARMRVQERRLHPSSAAQTLPAPYSADDSDNTRFDPELTARVIGDDFESTPSTTSDHAASLVGSLIVNRYYIERKLGQGNVGVVYLGQDRRLHNQPVVVKVLLGTSLQNQWVIQKFRQEVEALTRLSHPGIVRITDAGELPDKKTFIVMEFINGVTLHSAIAGKPMALARLAKLTKQIGSALAFAHEKGILHRDLKPENIMLQTFTGSEEQVRIIDFGIAKVRDSLVANNTMVPVAVGTPRYMSPEQLRAEPLTPASDVFSMGAIVYEMVTGHFLFEPRTIADLIDKHRAGDRVSPRRLRPDLPPAAENLILKALSLDPADRFQSAVEFGEALEQALTQTAEPLKRRSRGLNMERLGSWRDQIATQRRPLAVVIATAIIVPVGLTGVILLLPAGPAPTSKSLPSVSRTIAQPIAPPTTTTAPVASNTFTYWMNVQKAQTGLDENLPDSSQLPVVRNGDKLELNLFTPNPGYVYVMNEGNTDRGESSFSMIYPQPGLEGGSPRLEQGRTITLKLKISGRPGIEQFWMIWSTAPITELDAAQKAAFKSNALRLADRAIVETVRDFFSAHAHPEPDTKTEPENKKTIVTASADPLVKLLKLQHQ